MTRAVRLTLVALSLVACSKEQESRPAAPAPSAPAAAAPAAPGEAVTDADRQEAKDVFAARCTACHGPDGKGDGPASGALTPPPRNFHDAAWQGEVTDAHIEKIIALGGDAVGKSLSMPPNPDLAKRPGVVKALREQIRAMGKKP